MDINLKDLRDTIGFVITIAGALFSWWQASRAKKIKEEIADDRIKQTGRDLIALANSARDIIQKTKPLNTEKNLRGFSTEDSINSIQPFLNKLNDTVHLFSNKSLDTYSQTLKKQFSKYEKESDPAKLSELRKSVIESHNNIPEDAELGSSFVISVY